MKRVRPVKVDPNTGKLPFIDGVPQFEIDENADDLHQETGYFIALRKKDAIT